MKKASIILASLMAVIAHAAPIHVPYPAPFMLIDIRDIGSRVIQVGVDWTVPADDKHAKKAHGYMAYQAGSVYPSGAVNWPKEAKQVNISLEWLHTDPNTGATTTSKVNIKNGMPSHCLKGNQILTVTGNAKNDSVDLTCDPVPSCSSGKGVTMASGNSYCDAST